MALVALLALVSCSSDDGARTTSDAGDTAAASPSLPKTLSPLPMPEQTLSGTLTAELGQSSRDVALHRFQVWIRNGLDHQINPRRIVYHDQLLTRPVLGGRLRPIPSGSYRGYTLDLIEPICGATRGQATVTVVQAGGAKTFAVEDETGVVERWSHERCDEIAIDRIAPLEWTPDIEVEGTGADAVALFKLTATPTGVPGRSYTIDTVGGTPLFTSAVGNFWTVGRRVSSDGPAVTLELSAQPARCDSHAFGAAGGGTTFFVNLTIGESRKAQIRLAMSPELTSQAFAYAGEVCGF